MVMGPSGNSDGDSVHGGVDDGDSGCGKSDGFQIVFHQVKLASERKPCRQDQEYPTHRTDAYTGTHRSSSRSYNLFEAVGAPIL